MARPEARRRVRMLFERGMRLEGDVENRFGAHLAGLLDDAEGDAEGDAAY
ncbi:hypothetical protein ACIP98_40365 [Streptomyces sp. NPDC088354]